MLSFNLSCSPATWHRLFARRSLGIYGHVTGQFSAQQQSPACRQRAFLLGLLVTIFCGYKLFVQPLSLPARGNEHLMPALMFFTMAEWPLLALWMTMATESIGRRVSIGLGVFILLSGSMAAGTMLNASGYAHEAVVDAIASAIQFVLMCLPMIWVRRRYRWSLVIPLLNAHPRSSGQFSLLAIMFWTFKIAAWLMFLQFLGRISFQAAAPVFSAEAFGRSAATGLFCSVATLPLLPLAWFVLARGASRMIAAIVWIGVTAALAGISYLLLERFVSAFPSELLIGIALVIAGTHAGAVLPFVVLLLSGYRMIRIHSSPSQSAPQARRANRRLMRAARKCGLRTFS